MKEYVIREEENGRRMDQVLSKLFPKAKASFFHKMLRKKNIVLNGKKADASVRVKADDIIKMFLSEDTCAKFSADKNAAYDKIRLYEKAYVELSSKAPCIKIIYEDENILLVNKPVGVLSQAGSAGDISLNEWFCGHLVKSKEISEESLRIFAPSVANRLDMNTTGILVCVKNIYSAREFAAMQREKLIDKTYHAVVCGTLDKAGELSCTSKKISEHINGNEVFKAKITEKSDVISLEYEPIKVNKTENISLIAVKLYDGKMHQIRAQMSGIGHPVIGDYKYGDRKINDIFKKKFGLSTQLLHSREIRFPDSFTLKNASGGARQQTLDYLHGKSFKADYPELFEKIITEYFFRI